MCDVFLCVSGIEASEHSTVDVLLMEWLEMVAADNGFANMLFSFPAISASSLRRCALINTIQLDTVVESDGKLSIVNTVRLAIKETAADVILGIPLRRPLTLSLLVFQYSSLQSVTTEEDVLSIGRREIFSAVVSVARYVAYHHIVDKHSNDGHNQSSCSASIDGGGSFEATETCREEAACVSIVQSEEDWMRYIYRGAYELTSQNCKDGDNLIDICANIQRDFLKLLFRVFLHGKECYIHILLLSKSDLNLHTISMCMCIWIYVFNLNGLFIICFI